MKSIPSRKHLAAILAFAIANANVALAQDAEESFDMTTITCWDLTGIELEGRVPALMMLYGYVAGKHGLEVQESSEIGPALERVGKLCTANPDMYVIQAIERVVKTDSD